MAERESSLWPAGGPPQDGADSIAAEVASRIDAAPTAPGDALEWASAAARYEREALAPGSEARAALLLAEAGRIYEERLADPEGALGFYRRAVVADARFLPALRAARRLAMDRGDDTLAAELLQAEVAASPEGPALAELLLLRSRLLVRLGREAEGREALDRAAALAPDAFAVAEELARVAGADGDRPALAEAYLRCARTAADRRLSAHYLLAAAALTEEALGAPDRAAALALDAHALDPEDPVLRAAVRHHAARPGRESVLAALLQAEAGERKGAAAVPVLEALAWLEERMGRPEAALEALERAHREAPGETLVLAEVARLREARGEWEQASAALEALAAAHLAHRGPGGVQEAVAAKLRRAEVEEERLGHVTEALRCCREVVALEPANRGALSTLGRLCARAGDWEGLLAAFEAEAAAARDPHDRAQRTFKAAEVLEEHLSRPGDAAALYRAALEADPDLLPARAALERLHERGGEWEALCALLEADLPRLTAPAERAVHLFRMARLREERLGDRAGAAALYRRILEIEPGSRIALSALGGALAHLGDHAGVAEILGREAALTGDARWRVGLLQRRAELLEERLGDPERARAAWEEVVALSPDHQPALRALGRLHAAAGRWDDVAAMFRAEADAAADPARAAELVLRIGELLERRLGRPDEAVAAYREVLTLAPSHLKALLALARLYRDRADPESLVEILRALAVARSVPDEKAAALAEAARLCEEQLGAPGHAVDAYEEALRARPGFPAALEALDRLYGSLGRIEALAELRRASAAVADAPDRPGRLLRLAQLQADRAGDAPAALQTIDELERLVPGSPAALLLALRLAPDAERRAAAREALAAVASSPEPAAALLAAGALERAGPARRGGLGRAAALAAPGGPLSGEEERRLREAGDFAGLARRCEAERERASDGQARADWMTRAGDAWARAGEPGRAAEAYQAALDASPAHLPALRAARVLAATRGDWKAVRAALRAEADALQDRSEAAAALLEAGAVADRRLGDAEAAAEDYRRAAERDPGSPEPIARLEALLPGRAGPELTALQEARARVEQDPARAAAAWLDVARGALRNGAGAPAALEALDRALQAQPELAPALELRARIRTESGLPEDALADLERCLALGGEPAPRLALHLAAAALCQDGLRDPERTLPHLQAALAIAPEHAEALERLARIHRQAGRTGEAIAVLRRLVDLPGLPPGSQLEHLLALAGVETDPEAVREASRRALELDPGNAAAHRNLIRLEERRGDPQPLAAALEAAASSTRDRALRAEASLQAATLYAGPLRSRPRAVEHLRVALEADPARDDVRALLAEHCEELAPGLAVEEHRRLIARDPLRTASWTALYRLFERSRAHDRAYVTATILRWLGAPSPGPAAERLLLEGDRQALPAPPPLPPGDWQLLRDPRDRGPLSDLVEAAGDAVAALLAEVAPREEGPPLGAPVRADHPFRRLLGELARSLGAGEYEIYPAALGKLSVQAGPRQAVLVGADLARRTTAREQRFLLGRAAARLRARSALAEAAPEPMLADALAAAIRVVVPGYGGPAAGTSRGPDDLSRRLAKALSRRARKALEDPARALARERRPPDLEGWRTGAAASADRAGLVLCGDVPTALALLLREGTLADGASAVEAVRARPDALSLLAFAVSEEHFLLRQRLRVAIA